jgi:hypothetical protein
MRALTASAALLVLISFAPLAHAQTQGLGAAPLTVTVSPQYPQPYDAVTVTPTSGLIDLNASTVTISVNGKTISTGSGSRPATFIAGPAGETDTVEVTAVGSDGTTYTQTAVVTPASVALIIESLSTTHPFYEGAALIASEGRARLVVLPELRGAKGLIPAANLVYTWKNGNQILVNQSGIGRSTLSVISPIRYRDTTISVTVSSQDGSVTGAASVPLSPVDPSIIIYSDDPLSGPNFDSAVGTDFTMQGAEAAFRAVPYFFSGGQSLTWSVNGEKSGSDPVITVRTTGDTSGTASLSVAAADSDVLSSAQNSVLVHFNSSSQSTNIFGI